MHGSLSQFGRSGAGAPRTALVPAHLKPVGASRRWAPVGSAHGWRSHFDAIDPSLLTSIVDVTSATAMAAGAVAPSIIAARQQRHEQWMAERDRKRAARLERRRIRAQRAVDIARARAEAKRPVVVAPARRSNAPAIVFGLVLLAAAGGLIYVATRKPKRKRESANSFPVAPGYGPTPRRNRGRRRRAA